MRETRFRTCSAALLCLAASSAFAAQRGHLLAVKTSGDAQTAVVEVEGDRPLSFTTLRLSSPPRVVVDFPDAELIAAPSELEVMDGTIARVATAAAGTRTARVVIELAGEAEFDVRAAGRTTFLRIARLAPLVARAPEPEPSDAEKRASLPTVALVGPSRRGAPAGARTSDGAAGQAGPGASASGAAAGAASESARSGRAADASPRESASAQASREVARADSVPREVARADPASREVARADPASREVARADPASREVARADPASREVARADPASREVPREDSASREVARADPASREMARADPASREVARPDSDDRAPRGQTDAQEAGARAREQTSALPQREAAAPAPRPAAQDRAAAAQAERAGGPDRAHTAPAPPAIRPPARRASAARDHAAHRAGPNASITGIGFRPVSAGEVIIRSDRALEYGIDQADLALLVHLPSATIRLPNNRRPLDTRFFDGPVLRVVPLQSAGGTDLRIELRQHAAFQVHQDGGVLTVTFSPP